MKHLRERLLSLLNEERPERKCDRAVKAKPQRYATRVLRKPAQLNGITAQTVVISSEAWFPASLHRRGHLAPK
jgi:hypothetical protein